MQDIEPFYNWRDLYISSEDDRSPFYGRQYSEFEYSNTIYNYYIHPQWDYIGSPTLYIKVIYSDYDKGFAIIEFIGEWNDCINNDIMLLKRDFIDEMISEGINKFILIGENVLNFHSSDDCYYQEWYEDIQDEGWICAINFRQHVEEEFCKNNIDYNIIFGGKLDELNWRRFRPNDLFNMVENEIKHRLGVAF
jgi:hypothetical protein